MRLNSSREKQLGESQPFGAGCSGAGLSLGEAVPKAGGAVLEPRDGGGIRAVEQVAAGAVPGVVVSLLAVEEERHDPALGPK